MNKIHIHPHRDRDRVDDRDHGKGEKGSSTSSSKQIGNRKYYRWHSKRSKVVNDFIGNTASPEEERSIEYHPATPAYVAATGAAASAIDYSTAAAATADSGSGSVSAGARIITA
jgi:hypothetical protein